MAGAKVIAITGFDVLVPNGTDAETFWGASKRGDCKIRPISRFSCKDFACRVAGEIDDFTPNRIFTKKMINQTDRSTLLAMKCLDGAIDHAGVTQQDLNKGRLGVFMAGTFGGIEFSEPELYAQVFLGPERVSAYQAIAWFYAATQGQWTITRQVKGIGKSIVADRAGGLHAIIVGALALRSGHCEVAVCGGSDAPLSPFSLGIHQASGMLAATDKPEQAYRPFDRGSKGLVIAEGAGALVLEDLARAKARGAPIYGEILGFCVNHGKPSGEDGSYAACLAGALRSARLSGADIDFVLPDGVGVIQWDHIEAHALWKTFRACAERLVLTIPRTMIGHTLSAAGVIDVIWGSLMLREKTLLPTVNVSTPLEGLLSPIITTWTTVNELNTALIAARGQNGMSAVLILGKGG